MSYLEVAKIHPKLGKLLEKDAVISAKASEDFASNNGVRVEDIINMKVDASLLLGMNRYTGTVSAIETNKQIPNDVVFVRGY